MVCEPRLNATLMENGGSFDPKGRALLESHFEMIQRKLQVLSRRSGLPEHEAEELRSWALFKLVEDDYRILGRWEGRSSFSTYLTVVLVNLLRDYRIHVWGKWRPSAKARREGPDAVLLEQFLLRDGLSLAEAILRLHTEHGVSLSSDALERLAARLPQRTGRRSVGEAELLQIPVDGHVEARLEESEWAQAAADLRKVLPDLMRALPAEDNLVLRLHYKEGLSISAISRVLGIPQQELYKKRDRCLRKLRQALEKAGLGTDRIRALFGEKRLGFS